ncbi:uncharacterized protein LOC129789714 [Lutzomyia longipalpis]|uniref:Putative proline-rich receptor-like protein kinase perk9 n=1 Tax=Lutzomyia longipalpis TaxID=7200 RepID=A0A1B0CGF2_LUTLO|nr:uncharacterized protein LOC129789714 [Lutzomyia longipalpis]
MDSNAVLRKFVDLCNNQQSDQISLLFASNGVVDWYGRTLRGPRKIADFFRYNNQYYHKFADGKQCSPFEIRETHTATRQIPPENLTVQNEESTRREYSAKESCDNVPSTSAAEDSKGFMTPPQQDVSTPKLPALTHGHIFRKMSSSDDDDDDERLCSVRNFRETLHGADSSGLMELERHETPSERSLLQSRKRPASSDSSEETDEQSPKKRLKDADCDSGVVEGGDCDQLTDLYTELKYIEAFGSLEMRQRTKHRGVHAAPSTSQSSSTSHERLPPDDATDSHLVRQTKLNISYRLHRNGKDVQFALIVYENLTKKPTTRRNLINEFGTIEIDKTSKKTPVSKKNVDKTRKSVTAKKPLRF